MQHTTSIQLEGRGERPVLQQAQGEGDGQCGPEGATAWCVFFLHHANQDLLFDQQGQGPNSLLHLHWNAHRH